MDRRGFVIITSVELIHVVLKDPLASQYTGKMREYWLIY